MSYKRCSVPHRDLRQGMAILKSVKNYLYLFYVRLLQISKLTHHPT